MIFAKDFAPYNEVFDLFGFGLRIRARLLSRIYPFKSFLLPNGRLWIEREYPPQVDVPFDPTQPGNYEVRTTDYLWLDEGRDYLIPVTL